MITVSYKTNRNNEQGEIRMKKLFSALVIVSLLAINSFSLAYGLNFQKSKVVEGFLTSIGEKEVQIEEYGGEFYL